MRHGSSKVRLAPTRRGIAIAAGSVVCGAVAMVTGWSVFLGLAVAGVILLALAVAMVAGRSAVEVNLPHTIRVERGAPGLVPMVMTGSGLSHRSAVFIADAEGRTPIAVQGDSAVCEINVPTRSRGVHICGPYRIERSDLFGLWVWHVVRTQPMEALVLPRVTQLSPAFVTQAITEAGQASAGSSTVSTLREYVVGDELRQIHWRSSARTGTLMVRQYVDVTRPMLVVLVDVDPDHYRSLDDLDDAVDLAASIALANIDLPVEVHTSTGLHCSLSTGRTAMLEMLSRAVPGPGQVRPKAGLVVVVNADLLGRSR